MDRSYQTMPVMLNALKKLPPSALDSTPLPPPFRSGMNRAGHDADGSPMGGQGQQSAKPKEGRDDGDEALWQEENSKKNRKNHRAFGPNNSSDKGNGRVSERGTDDVRGAEDVGLSTKVGGVKRHMMARWMQEVNRICREVYTAFYHGKYRNAPPKIEWSSSRSTVFVYTVVYRTDFSAHVIIYST